jgi:protein SCO1/2
MRQQYGFSLTRFSSLLAVLLTLSIHAYGQQATHDADADTNSAAKTVEYSADAAINRSQAALGQPLRDLVLTDSNGASFSLADLRGKPVIVSMIFTSCHHVCPAITRHLAKAVRNARDALGEDSFQVLTIGFDTPNDTPSAMASFARQQKVSDSEWWFLSSDEANMQQLTDNLGFSYFPTPRGFDHVNQLTLIDRDGVIYRQVYGADFELPALVEPLKELVLNRPQPGSHFSASLVDRVKLFCTVYDPSTGRYRFDYSLFVQIAIGGIFLLLLGGWLVFETSKAVRKKSADRKL